MRNVFLSLTAIICIGGSSTGVFAQTPSQAIAEARARVACGNGTIVSAQYLGSGALQVTCSQNTTAETALAGTGLATLPPAAALAGVGLLIILIGGGDDPSSATTTTTTTTSPSDR